MSNVTSTLTLSLVDGVSGKAGAISNSLRGIGDAATRAGQAKVLAGRLESLNQRSAKIDAFQKAHADLVVARQTFRQAQDRVRGLAKEMAAAGAPSKKLAADYERAQLAVKKASGAFEKQTAAVKDARRAMESAGVPVAKMKASQERIRAEIAKTTTALKHYKHEARAAAMAPLHRGPGGAALGAASAAALRSGLGALGLIGGGAGAAMLAKSSFTNFAAVDRRLTRLGITAGASGEAVRAAMKQIVALANETALPVDQVVTGLEDLVVQGKRLPEAMALLPTIAKTAQASGATMEDTSKTAGAIADSLKISADEMLLAMDRLVEAGNLGRFEFRDMAQYLPTIAANAAQVGYKGVDSLTGLAAALQIIRKNTGNAEQAANGLRDLMAKVYSNDVQKNFKKMGVDLDKMLKDGKKKGKDFVDVVIEAVDKATKGDDAKLYKLFGEIDSRNAVMALRQYREELKELRQQIGQAKGAVEKGLTAVIDDAQAAIDRLSNSSNSAMRAIGRLLDAGGATKGMEGFSSAINTAVEAIEKFKAAEKSVIDARERRARGELTPEEQKVPLIDAPPEVIEKRKETVADNHRLDSLNAQIAAAEGAMKRRADAMPWQTLPMPDATAAAHRRNLEALRAERDALRKEMDGEREQAAPPSAPVRQYENVPLPRPRPDNVPVPRPRDQRAALEDQQGAASAGRETGEAYRASLLAELNQVAAEIGPVVQSIKNMLSFRASPTITPRVAAATGQGSANEDVAKVVRAELDRQFRVAARTVHADIGFEVV